MTLGESFYSCFGLTENIAIQDLRNKILSMVERKHEVDSRLLYGFLNGIYVQSFPMSLYDNSELNINNSAKAIRSMVL